jgi:predicted nucleotidyltransferase component of viral defense system
MITNQELKNLVTEWNLRAEIIEKDYVIGWVLWGISQESGLNDYWAFKGGTSLKKCYMETWRFSEDLDFTIIPGGPDKPKTIEPLIFRMLERVHEESGIDFSLKRPFFKHNEEYRYTEGRIYYRGPNNATNVASIKLDVTGSEAIIQPTVLQPVSHPYSDKLPVPATVRCYAFEEVFAEKLRAMGERGRPRDLYDIVLLFRRKDVQTKSDLIKRVLEEKCKTKGVSIPTLESIQNAATKGELISEWENMLGHQLQALPPFDEFWAELPNIFAWLGGDAGQGKLPSIGIGRDEERAWRLPPTISQWGFGIPLESIRFAAVNHLCTQLGYQTESGEYRTLVVEPYSLRQTKDGNYILHAIDVQTGILKSYRIDRIKSINVTNQTFRPKYNIEFYDSGIIHAKPSLTD